MNYSKKHIKKIIYNKLCGYHNRIIYLNDSGIHKQYVMLHWVTARHYSNVKDCYRW